MFNSIAMQPQNYCNVIGILTPLSSINKHQRIQTGQSKMNNPEKLATQGTQDEDTHKKHSTFVCWTHVHANNTNNINMTRALLQTTVGKDEPNIVLLRYLIKPRYIVPYDSAFVFRCDDEFFQTSGVTDTTTRNSERNSVIWL